MSKKYSRPVAVDTQVRMYDVVDTAKYDPRPAWGQTDAELLDRIFAPNKAEWVEAGVWFVEVCGGVQDGAVYSGGGYMLPASYLNPDGSDGNGDMPEVEEP
jgi:hypothetical protein